VTWFVILGRSSAQRVVEMFAPTINMTGHVPNEADSPPSSSRLITPTNIGGTAP